jgi:EmrB/QacA subfamily drug resistance transporter
MRTRAAAVASEQKTSAVRGKVKLAIGGLAIAMLLSSLDLTIVATALPSITGDLGGLNAMTWVVSAYLLTTAASTPLYGKLSDMFGRRTMVLIAVTSFIVFSALCGIARNMDQLIAFRALQGLGAGGLMSLGTAGIADLVPLHERGKSMAYSGAVFAVGSVGGPLLGGLFTEYLNWRWVFYINVPLGIAAAALIIVNFRVPHTVRRAAVDYLGSVLLVGGVTGVMLALEWGGRDYAWGSPQVVGLIVGGAALIALCLLWESRAKNPVLPLRLFAIRAINYGVGISILMGALLFGAVVFLPQFLQATRGMSAAGSGLALTPLMLGVVATMVVTGNRVTKTGVYRPYPIVGAALTLVGFIGLSQLDAGTPLWLLITEMAVIGLGIGCFIQIIVLVMQNSAQPQDLGVASSTAMFCRTLGGALGTAVFGTVLTHRLTSELVLPGGPSPSATTRDNFIRHALTGASGFPPAVRGAFTSAFARSVHLVYVVATPIAAALLVLTILQPAVSLWTMAFLKQAKAKYEAERARQSADAEAA